MNTHLKQLWAAMKLPEKLQKSYKFFCRGLDIRVPEDVALTGFDDDEDRMLYPFFSTVHVDTKWLGRRMVHEFLWREEHPEAPKERILVSGEVVVRRSSCKRQG